MVKKIMLYILMFCNVVVIHAERKLAFIDADFDDFVNHVVMQDETEKMNFKLYFASLDQKIQTAKKHDSKKEKATYRYLYNLALERLATKHAAWYQELLPYVSDPRYTLNDDLNEVRDVIKFFLTRYGAYEEYLNLKATKEVHKSSTVVAQNDGILDTVKSYFSAASNKVAGFFGFGSKKDVVI